MSGAYTTFASRLLFPLHERAKGHGTVAIRRAMEDSQWWSRERLEASLERMSEIMIAIGTGLVLWFGTERVMTGILTPGDLLVFTSYLAAMYKPLRKIAQVVTRVSKAKVCAERVFALLAVDERVRVSRSAVAAPRFQGRVGFRHIHFAYRAGIPVVEDVSVTIRPGRSRVCSSTTGWPAAATPATRVTTGADGIGVTVGNGAGPGWSPSNAASSAASSAALAGR